MNTKQNYAHSNKSPCWRAIGGAGWSELQFAAPPVALRNELARWQGRFPSESTMLLKNLQ
ncbi:MAG TPA: hypothetical protein P5186_01055 [Candidatus Paceibacterota bacterium]|nr:hypothetical protein [Candidatus Paceibacterota bacterium]